MSRAGGAMSKCEHAMSQPAQRGSSCSASPSVCIAHGVTTFGDPTASGFNIGPSSGINPQSPTLQAADTARRCSHAMTTDAEVG
jgi:hypothetical protein